MKNEIKEILEVNGKKYNVNLPKEVKEAFTCIDYELSVCSCELPKILDYITNLQEELEDLREDNYAYHQLMRMQNKREYRSKFLKEFQEEYGTNTFPDYDEIYKRYDKMKKGNEKIKERCEYLKLEQTKKVFDVLADLISKGESCSYRYLIYDLLGFEHSAYTPLISGMTITNALVDFQELKQKRGDINDVERN